MSGFSAAARAVFYRKFLKVPGLVVLIGFLMGADIRLNFSSEVIHKNLRLCDDPFEKNAEHFISGQMQGASELFYFPKLEAAKPIELSIQGGSIDTDRLCKRILGDVPFFHDASEHTVIHSDASFVCRMNANCWVYNNTGREARQ